MVFVPLLGALAQAFVPKFSFGRAGRAWRLGIEPLGCARLEPRLERGRDFSGQRDAAASRCPGERGLSLDRLLLHLLRHGDRRAERAHDPAGVGHLPGADRRRMESEDRRARHDGSFARASDGVFRRGLRAGYLSRVLLLGHDGAALLLPDRDLGRRRPRARGLPLHGELVDRQRARFRRADSRLLLDGSAELLAARAGRAESSRARRLSCWVTSFPFRPWRSP